MLVRNFIEEQGRFYTFIFDEMSIKIKPYIFHEPTRFHPH
jgi:hypothetical protein